MLPVSFPEANLIYTKPEGWTDEQCSDLPVWKGQCPIDDDGTMCSSIISCWKFSKEDLEEINRTGLVWLSISGVQLPPVSVFTENPFQPQPQTT